MLELGNFNFQFFFPGSGRLVFEPFPPAILKTGLAFLFVLLYPLVNLLVAGLWLVCAIMLIVNTAFANAKSK